MSQASSTYGVYQRAAGDLPPVDWNTVPFSAMPKLRIFSGVLTYNQAMMHHRSGLITDRQWRWYVLFWVWSAVRISDVEDGAAKQARFCQTHGIEALERRMQRMNALRHRIYCSMLSPYVKANDR